jgi:hypothetical protein
MNMPEMAATEQLPAPEARAGDPAAWDALFRSFRKVQVLLADFGLCVYMTHLYPFETEDNRIARMDEGSVALERHEVPAVALLRPRGFGHASLCPDISVLDGPG